MSDASTSAAVPSDSTARQTSAVSPAPTAQRLFLALRPNPAATAQIAAIADQVCRRANQLRIAARWVEPVNYHITLAFAGWSRWPAHEALASLAQELADATAQLRVTWGPLQAFDSVTEARVLWLAVHEPSGALAKLGELAQLRVRALGYELADRPFTAHLTLARFAQPQAISELILPFGEQMFSESVLDCIEVIDSQAKSDGYAYTVLAKKMLSSPGNAGHLRDRRQSDSLELASSSPAPVEPETDDGWPKGQGPNW